MPTLGQIIAAVGDPPEWRASNPEDIGIGGGLITGPDPSINHAIARWDGITGKILLDSPVTVEDDNEIKFYSGGVAIASIKAVAA